MPDELAVGRAGVRLGERDLASDPQRPALISSAPLSARTGARKLTLISIEEMPTPGGSSECTAQPAAESNSVHSRPPWTSPIGL